MLKLLSIVCIWLAAFPALSQSTSKYQVGTITEVSLHQDAGSRTSGGVSYDVSIKVGDTIYVVLYTPPQGVDTVKYAAGRQGLVLVGESTIRYSDLLGQPHELSIEHQKPATNPRESAPANSAAK